MRINEIFVSLQGEGRWTGTPCIFIRFAGCNQDCSFCDTNHHSYIEYTEEEILQQEVFNSEIKHIVLTGGEPTLQITGKLLDLLHSRKSGSFIQIETNGSVALPSEVYSKIDWVTCSPKNLPVKIQRIDELKVVWQRQDMKQYDAILHTSIQCRYIQPCDVKDIEVNAKNTAEAINYILEHPQWKLSLQTQKILNLR